MFCYKVVRYRMGVAALSYVMISTRKSIGSWIWHTSQELYKMILLFVLLMDDLARTNMCAKIGVSLEGPCNFNFTQFGDRLRTYIDL
mgnify:CR=1 FL=1